MIRGMEHLSHKERLRELLRLFSLEKGRFLCDLIAALNTWREPTRIMGRAFLQGHVVMGQDLKLKQGGFRLSIRKKIFTVRMVRHWSRLLWDAVGASFWEVFKAGLIGWCLELPWVSQPVAGVCNQVIFRFTSNPNRSVVLWVYENEQTEAQLC